jgi:hypothetical protein
MGRTIRVQLFGQVLRGGGAASCLRVFEDTGRGKGGRDGGKGGSTGRRSGRITGGDGVAAQAAAPVPMMHREKPKNRTEADQIGPPPLEKKSVSAAGPIAPTGYIASNPYVSRNDYL